MTAHAGYDLKELLWRDAEVAFWRGRKGNGQTVLVRTAVADQPKPATLGQLVHEYSLRGELASDWAARPLALVSNDGRLFLEMEDGGGTLLEHQRGRPLDLARFLTLALAISDALAKVHEQGLIHKDVRPATILIETDSDGGGPVRARLTGFGVAAHVPREHQSPEPLDIIAGTFAYMAPEQTGRMNRSIDSRSDLYAFGITCHELLTGELPFQASDPMEWVHCHIARTPPPLATRRPDLPEPVVALVAKLMAKTAEDRYQTALGVAADLRRCVNDLATRGRIEPFSLGTQDYSGSLVIPEKLYGRDRESRLLQDAFGGVARDGVLRLVMISGYSGIGKSSLTNELHKAIVGTGGLFLSGKFDQYKRDIPYATLAQALQSLIRQVLTQADTEVRRWREALGGAVGANGRLMVDLVPELEFLLGPQPPVPEVSSSESERRFLATFCGFVAACTALRAPLVLFLDDLQWSDLGSLTLLKYLAGPEAGVRHLLLIGAYRDNEVSPAHPLMLALNAIRSQECAARLHEITLAPLTIEDLSHLISDALSCSDTHARPLAEVVHEKTAGNPFFSVQFLATLHEERLLDLDPRTGRWQWALAAIQDKGYTDNVVELMVGKLQRLAPATQQTLQELACLGNSADITTLAIVHNRTEEIQAANLREAVRAGFVLQSRERFTFVHDRIHEAAYALIPADQRPVMHLNIGRRLVSRLPPSEQEEAVFDIVNQLNRGSALVAGDEERALLRRLNFLAGRKAKAAAAYASARTYLAQATDLVSPVAWHEEYAETFPLFLECAACEYLAGNLQDADDLFTVLLRQARTDLDRARVFRLQVSLYQVAGRFEHAVAATLDAARLIGITWPETDAEIELAVAREFGMVAIHRAGRSLQELLETPLTTDAGVRSVLGVLIDAMPAAYFARPTLYPLVVLTALNLTLSRGNIEESAAVYMGYAIILMAMQSDMEGAFEFSDLALRINEKYKTTKLHGPLLCRFGLFLNSHRRHHSTSIPILQEGFVACQEVGNLTYAAYAALEMSWLWFELGLPLTEVIEKIQPYIAFAEKSRNTGLLQVLRTENWFLGKLAGAGDGETDRDPFDPTVSGSSAGQGTLEPQVWLSTLVRTGFGGGIAYFHVMSLIRAVFLQRYDEALEHRSQARPKVRAVMGWVVEVAYHYYGAIAIAGAFDQATPERQKAYRAALSEHLALLEIRARTCPENYRSRHSLVMAEEARIEGRTMDALGLYEQAIAAARENGFLHQQALACELAAGFHRTLGLATTAEALLRQAHAGYQRWGAVAKVRQLEQAYPALLGQPIAAPLAAGKTTAPQFGGRVEDLDLISVLKVSQAVSGELVLGSLIETLLRLVIEQAGADRGLLILTQSQEAFIEAEAITEGDQIRVQVRHSAVSPSTLPLTLLHYVLRTHHQVLLNNASTPNPYSSDPYVTGLRPKSVLCLPVVKQSRLIGVLYLENKLVAGAFTRSRLAVLELLSAQAAISLDNAILYNDLERRVQERTQALTTEVAERTAAQVRLNQTLAELELILNNASLGICIVTIDPQGHRRIRRVNRALERMLGYDPGELLNLDNRFLYADEAEYQAVGAGYRARLRLGQSFHAESQLRRKDGAIIIAELVGSALDPEDLSKGTIWLLEDVTELRRTMAALETAKNEAESALRTLRATQESLVAAEKLASLGGLVAGVAHEINTPVGTALTAASTLTVKTEKLTRLFAEGKMRKSDLQDYVGFAQEITQAVETNLTRAAELVQSFKQVAVDRTSAERRRFRLKEYVEEVLVSLRPTLRKAGATVEVVCPETLEVDTYPGAISQILTNLITNSLIHAFEPRQPGRMSISATLRTDKMIELRYEDDGRGIPKNVIGKIFDPFFTTRRGAGGSGLGLHIVHNIISGPLQGRIHVESEPGAGSRFTVTMPQIAPQQKV